MSITVSWRAAHRDEVDRVDIAANGLHPLTQHKYDYLCGAISPLLRPGASPALFNSPYGEWRNLAHGERSEPWEQDGSPR